MRGENATTFSNQKTTLHELVIDLLPALWEDFSLNPTSIRILSNRSHACNNRIISTDDFLQGGVIYTIVSLVS